MSLRLPQSLVDKASRFPESSYGATTVTLVLSDGRWISQVVLAGGVEIVKVRGQSITTPAQLDFSLADISDVLPEPLPAWTWLLRLHRSVLSLLRRRSS